MFKTRFISMLVLLAAVVTGAWADGERTSHWPDFSPENYEKNNTLVAGIMIDGVIITADYDGWDQLEVAPFIGDECRCVHGESASYLYNGYVQEYGDPFPVLDGMLIFYNGEGGDEVTFKMYNHATGVEYTACDVTYLGDPITIKTGDEHMEGWDDPENPVFLNFTTPEPAAPAASTYTVTLKEGTEDATSWTIAPDEATTTGVAAGTEVKATYGGTKKVKSVKAVKKAAAATTLNNTIKAWTAGSYAVPTGGLTYSDAITVSGDVTLTLTDGETLTLNKGISLAEGATLTIQGNGTMNVNGTNENTSSTVAGSTGTLILTSGTLTATGGNGGGVAEYSAFGSQGGNGGDAINGSVIVSGGTLNAKGGDGQSVFDADYFNGGSGGTAINGSVTVSGGTLTAIGGNGGNINLNDSYGDSYGGSGGTAITGSVTINSGTLAATGGDGGSLNCGMDCHNCKAGNGGDAIGGSVTENGGTTKFANGSDGSYSTDDDCSDLYAGSGGKSHN